MSALHWAIHHADYLAAICTGASTVLLAMQKRAGFPVLMVGVAIWFLVGVFGTLAGRPIWGMLIANAWSFIWAWWGYKRWRRA